MKTKISSYAVATVAAILLSSCCGNKFVTCPDGRPVSFPKSEKCARKAYTETAKEFSLKFKATVDVADQVTVGIDNLEIKNEVHQLREKLNQESIQLQEILKSSYLLLVRDPCKASDGHTKLLESLSAKNFELLALREKLKSINDQRLSKPAFETEVDNTLRNYLFERGRAEGRAVGQIARALDTYFQVNGKYPETLEALGNPELFSVVSTAKLDYKKIADNEYTLRFAGEDSILHSPDDKLSGGKDGRRIE